jgi:DNA (cytosine-5)-methyltransferase 1
MPLTLDEIETFRPQSLFDNAVTKSDYKKNLKHQLDDLVRKGYLVYETPKKVSENYSTKGYNIVVGKLSFSISNILDPKGHSPTLVATDVTRIAVADRKGLRRLSINEGLRLFGFPKNYRLEKLVKYTEAFDLLGNSVCINVINIISERLIKALSRKQKSMSVLVAKANYLDL